MTELRLDYDRSLVPQVTAWSCGAAAAEIILDSLGRNPGEWQLISEIGTHTGGTDHIGWIVDRSLRKRVPEADYRVVEMPRDPPTDSQAEALWQHITRSIRAGFGLPMNWVVPANNRPRGVKGSISPGYPASTTYHYVACMGFAEHEAAANVPGGRAVWIADSANFGNIQGFWISFWQCATLIPPKGYGWAAASPIVVEPPPAVVAPPAPGDVDRVGLLTELMGNAVTRERYAELLAHVADALVRTDCLTVDRIAMWIAQIGHESVGLKYFRELWGPTPDQLTYQGRMGNDQPGDGQRYLGRGPLQVTGKNNYRNLSKWAFDRGYIEDPQLFVTNPELLETPEFGFMGAIWYLTEWHNWYSGREPIMVMADRRDIRGVTHAINGGYNGLPDREGRYNRALGRGDALLALVSAPESGQEPPDLEPELPYVPPGPEPEPELPYVPPPGPPTTIPLMPSPEQWDQMMALQRETLDLVRDLAEVTVQIAGLLTEQVNR